jgi:hypothetical protein
MSDRVHRRGSLWKDFRLIWDLGLFKGILSRHTQFGYNRTATSATIYEDVSKVILLTTVREIMWHDDGVKRRPELRLHGNIPRFYNDDSSYIPKTQSERTVAFTWQQCCVICLTFLLLSWELYIRLVKKFFVFTITEVNGKNKRVKFTLQLAIKVQTGSRGTALLFP